MLLVIDVGNTNTVFGLFQGERPLFRGRQATRRYALADDLGAFLLALLGERGIAPGTITAVALSSVVPPLTPALREMSRRYLGLDTFVVEPGVNTPLAMRYENPAALGADRAVNAVAAIRLYGAPAIVADFGTATKFEAINAAGEYLGGAIAPGLRISAEALFGASALLYRVDLSGPPPRVVGRETGAMARAGIMLGYQAMAEGMIARFKAELASREPGLSPSSIKVIGTGGLAGTVSGESNGALDFIDDDLTLQGIRLVYEANEGR